MTVNATRPHVPHVYQITIPVSPNFQSVLLYDG